MGGRGLLKLALAFSVSMNLAALVAAGYRHACNARSCALPGGGEVARPPIEQLALSGTQRERFEELRDEFHAQRDRSHARMEVLRKRLLDEVLSDPPSRARIDEIIGDMSARQAELQRAFVAHLLAEKALLRDEQRATFHRILERHFVGGHDSPPGAGAPRARP